MYLKPIGIPQRKIFNTVIHKLYHETASMQRKYDEDTMHGMITESQTEWEKKNIFGTKELRKICIYERRLSGTLNVT
jgi:hypothetical protein